MLLALDTATSYASIALYDGEKVLAELNWHSQRRFTVDLASQVDQLFRLVQITPDQLTGLAVSIGPGSYTGTRIALSFAKGLVATRPLPMVGIPTLDLIAYPHLPTMEPVCAMVAMGRERFAWALYHSGEVENDIYLPKRLTSFQVNNMAEILIQLNPPIMFVGELDARARRDIRQAWEEDWADLISPALSVRRGAVLAELGWLRIQKGQTDDPDTLNAIYIK